MLAVIALITIVAVALVPAISSMNKSSSRLAAASLVLANLDQARAMALSHNSSYYLVFANNDPAWPEEYRCRAFAIYEEVFTPSTDPKVSPYKWFEVSGWTKLPTGIAFDPAAATVYASSPSDPSLPTAFHCNVLGKDVSGSYFKFNSIGAVEEPTDSNLATVKIFEGFVNPNGTLVFTNKAPKAEEVIKVSLATGRAKRLQPEDL